MTKSQSAHSDQSPGTTDHPDGAPAHPVPAQYLLGIDHVGIAVADLDAAIAWYADVLGFVCTHQEVNEAQGVREAMLSPANALDTGSTPDAGTQIQLLAPLTEDSTIAKFLGRHGPGMQQLAYRVSDLAAVSTHLRERGVRLLYDTARSGTAGSSINFLHPRDTGGVLVELVQPR